MVDFGSKEDSASYREEDAAKTGHAVGSRGPGGGNEQRVDGHRRFMGGPACIAHRYGREATACGVACFSLITRYVALPCLLALLCFACVLARTLAWLEEILIFILVSMIL